MKNRPIGVFDSGVGGLTVVQEIWKIMPEEEVLYFADTANVPYGDKPLSEIKSIALKICDFLVQEKVKMIIMGCNISSAIALSDAQKEYPIPIIGLIEAAVEEAIRVTMNKRIGIIATQGTILSRAYQRNLESKDIRLKIFARACPPFVPIVEKGEIDAPQTKKIIEEYIQPLLVEGIDTLILGCTHYPFLKTQIEEITGDKVKTVDPAKGTVKKAKEILEQKDLRNNSSSGHSIQFLVTGTTSSIINLGGKFLGREIKEIKTIKI